MRFRRALQHFGRHMAAARNEQLAFQMITETRAFQLKRQCFMNNCRL